MAEPVPSFFRTRAHGACVLGVLALGCTSAHGLDSGLARDVGANADAPPDASVDAPAALDALDAPPPDAPPVPIDAPWVAPDAPGADVLYVAGDAGPCATGDYVLEGTPVALEPVSLGVPSTTGWREVWQDAATGAWEVHEVAADLESVTTLAALSDLPLEVGGFGYAPVPTRAVDPVAQATLVAFRPVASFVDHVLLAVYGLDGVRRSAPVRIEASGGEIHAAWAGTGYSLFVVAPIGSGRSSVRAELDALGAVRSRAEAELDASVVSFAYHEGTWYGLTRVAFGALGGVVAVAEDGAVTHGPSTGGAYTLHGGAYAELGAHYWALVSSYAVPSPPALVAFDPAGALAPSGAQLFSAPTWLAAFAIAAEDAETAGVLVATGDAHWFFRVRGGVVIERLRLPDAPYGPALLRFLGDRYAIGWGVFLDELVRCP